MDCHAGPLGRRWGSLMDFNMRVLRIDQAIGEKGTASIDDLVRATGSSVPTLRRDLKYMREKLDFPVEYSRKSGGYRYAVDSGRSAGRAPAVWFSSEEIAYLLRAYRALEALRKSRSLALIGSAEAASAASRLYARLGENDKDRRELLKRVDAGSGNPSLRGPELPFEIIGHAMVKRRRVRVRIRGERNDSELSPLSLRLLGGGWTLCAWSHGQERILPVPLEAVMEAKELQTRTHSVSQQLIREAFEEWRL